MAELPLISIAIANYNSRQFLQSAVESALAQTGVSVEVLIVDDGSSDGSDTMAEALAVADERVRFFRTPRNGGPAAARNIALRELRGDWYAMLDSDDLFAHDRCARLVEIGDNHDADMVADDLTVFGDGVDHEARHLGADQIPDNPLTIDAYLAYPVIFGRRPNLGFLKPIIRAGFLARHSISYDENLRIGEDDMLVLDCLLSGARYHIVDSAGYQYRKHGASISHRLSAENAQRMVDAGRRFNERLGQANATALSLAADRQSKLEAALAFTRSIDALKQKRPLAAIAQTLRHPASLPLFAMPLRARLARIF